jgi:hypothetical protein
MNKLNVTLFFPMILAGALAACGGATESSSEVKLETDDSETAETHRLVDVSKPIEDFVNGIVSGVRETVNPGDAPWTDAMKEQLLRDVQRLTSGPRKGTGVGFTWATIGFEISVLTQIEAHLMETLATDRHEIKYTKFKDSIYRDNPVGLFSWHVPSHITSGIADHSIAPAIRVGGKLIGIDKLGHFFEQGYWYFDATRTRLLEGATERREFGAYMEGDPDLSRSLHEKYEGIYRRYCPPCTRLGGFGYYGSKATGVISYADMDANEAGHTFYEKLWDDPAAHEFRFADFSLDSWNEQINKSRLIPGITITGPAGDR